MMPFSNYDLQLIVYALKEQHVKVINEFNLLLVTKTRDLNQDERNELPSTLVEFSREELREQIDACDSLKSHYGWLIKEIEEIVA